MEIGDLEVSTSERVGDGDDDEMLGGRWET
jgi:hypothetical protein